MSNDDKIIEKFGRDAGYRAPEGFLEGVYARVESERGPLPEYRHRVVPTFWQKIRPYIALAAMFAGIWCMMKVFNIAQQQVINEPLAIDLTQPVSLENPPQAIAQAVASPEIQADIQISDATVHDTEADMALEDDIQDSYSDFNDFEKAFDYDFDVQYADMDIDALAESDQRQ